MRRLVYGRRQVTEGQAGYTHVGGPAGWWLKLKEKGSLRSGPYVNLCCKFSWRYRAQSSCGDTVGRKGRAARECQGCFAATRARGGMGWACCSAWRLQRPIREAGVLNNIGSRVALGRGARDWGSLRRPLGRSSASERQPQQLEPAMSSNQGHGESPPSARPSMSAPSDQGPLALFDLYLRILSDSYLAFLQERFAHSSFLALV